MWSGCPILAPGRARVGAAPMKRKSFAMNETSKPPGRDLWLQIQSRLDPAFAEKCDRLLDTLLAEGVVMRPFSGMRSPLEQALLWCQSRTPLERELMARRLEDERAVYLARVLRRAGVVCFPARWATNNLPGQSWHNFGLALDSHVVSEDGRAVWGPKHPAYARYAEAARQLGLYPGYDWTKQDVVHIQGPTGPVRLLRGSWVLVDRELEKLYPSDAG